MASAGAVGFRKFRFFSEEPTDVLVPHSVSASVAADGVIWLGCEDGRCACCGKGRRQRIPTVQVIACRRGCCTRNSGFLIPT